MPLMAELRGLLRRWWPLLLGNVLEWYEFGVYGSLTKQLTANFFRGSAIGAWSGFAITFLLRPVGGIVFGRLADRLGRKATVLWSMRGMLLATVAQGLLPSLICCGEASADVGLALLICLRVLQGLCTGGEIGPLVAYLAESSPHGALGVGTVLFLLSALIAFTISSSFVALLVLLLGPENMLTWGWRVPFVVVLAPGLLTLWGRSALPESTEFMKLQGERSSKLQQNSSRCQSDVQTNPRSASTSEGGEPGSGTMPEDAKKTEKAGSAVLEVAGHVGQSAGSIRAFLWDYGYSVVVGFSVVAAPCASAYIGIWCAPHLAKKGGLDQASALGVSSLMYAISGSVAFACAVICDTYLESDPFIIVAVGTGCLTLVGYPVFWGLEAYSGSFLAAVLCVSVVFGAAQGAALSQAYNFCTCIFPTHLRAVGFGLTFNLAMAYVGGSSALVAQALDGVSPRAPGAYISALGLCSLLAVLWAFRLRRTGRLCCHPIAVDAPAADEVASAATVAAVV